MHLYASNAEKKNRYIEIGKLFLDFYTRTLRFGQIKKVVIYSQNNVNIIMGKILNP